MTNQHKNAELLSKQLDADVHKETSSKLIEREKIENTPFTAVRQDGEGWKLTVGQYLLTDQYETLDELIHLTEKVDYNLILNLILAAQDAQNKLTNTKTSKQ